MDHQCGCGGHHKDEGELGIEYSLHQKINFEEFECLNEREDGSGVKVFKAWEDRLNKDTFVESDDGDELLFKIPFIGDVKLKGIILVCGTHETAPSVMKLYKNRPNLDIEKLPEPADQEFELYKDEYGVHEYPIKVVKFSSVQHLTLHITGNANVEKIRIYYIGLKGEWSPGNQHGVTICTYEVLPQVNDHAKDSNDFSKEIQ